MFESFRFKDSDIWSITFSLRKWTSTRIFPSALLSRTSWLLLRPSEERSWPRLTGTVGRTMDYGMVSRAIVNWVFYALFFFKAVFRTDCRELARRLRYWYVTVSIYYDFNWLRYLQITVSIDNLQTVRVLWRDRRVDRDHSGESDQGIDEAAGDRRVGRQIHQVTVVLGVL